MSPDPRPKRRSPSTSAPPGGRASVWSGSAPAVERARFRRSERLGPPRASRQAPAEPRMARAGPLSARSAALSGSGLDQAPRNRAGEATSRRAPAALLVCASRDDELPASTAVAEGRPVQLADGRVGQLGWSVRRSAPLGRFPMPAASLSRSASRRAARRPGTGEKRNAFAATVPYRMVRSFVEDVVAAHERESRSPRRRSRSRRSPPTGRSASPIAGLATRIAGSSSS